MLGTDHVFPPDTSNQQVFEVVAENVIWSTMEGFNGTTHQLTPASARMALAHTLALVACRYHLRLRPDQLWQDLHNEGLLQEPWHDSTRHPGRILLHQAGIVALLVAHA